MQNIYDWTSQQRWSMMDRADAWSDVINVYRKFDAPKAVSFTSSVSNTIHGPGGVDRGSRPAGNGGEQTLQCALFQGSGSGAASWDSMVIINELRQAHTEKSTTE